MNVLFFLFLGLTGQAANQSISESHPDESLRGLDAFKVLVGIEKSRIVPPPITDFALKTDGELRLRSLGIPLSEGAVPYLAITLNVQPLRVGGRTIAHIFRADVTYYDFALLSSGKKKIVSVWSVGGIGTTTPADSEQDIRNAARSYVDMFANAWLKTHPKEPATVKPKGGK